MQWELAKIVVAFHQNVEGAELHLLVMLTGMQRIEIGDTVNAQDDGFTINDELLSAQYTSSPRTPCSRIAIAEGAPARRAHQHVIVRPNQSYVRPNQSLPTPPTGGLGAPGLDPGQGA